MTQSEQIPAESERKRQAQEAAVNDLREAVRRKLNAENAARKGAEESARAMRDLCDTCAELCHDMLHSRSQDAWSLAFAHLVNYSLARLGDPDENVRAAMFQNLRQIASALEAAFPEGRRTASQVLRAIDSLSFGQEPKGVSEDLHPFVDTLAKEVLTVRDTGYRLGGFRGFYATHGTSLYLIRPA